MTNELSDLLRGPLRVGLLGAGLAGASLSAGCSLIIDVEPDCVDSSCGAYVCASDGVACLDVCGGDADCASGNVCEAGACVPSGCRVVVAVDELAMPSLVTEMEPVWVTGPGVDSQLVVFASNRHGFGLRRFALSGTPVTSDPSVEPLSMFPLVEGNELRRRFRVETIYRTGVAEPLLSSRIDFSFANVPTTGDVLHLGAFDFGPPRVTAPVQRQIVDPGRNTEILDTALVRTDAGVLVAWTQRRGTRPEARVVVSGDAGPSVGADATVVVSGENEASERIAAFQIGTTPLVAYEAVESGDRRLIVRPLQADGQPIGRGVLMAGREAASTTVDAVQAFSDGADATLLWGTVSAATVSVQYAEMGPAEVALLEPGSSVVLQSRQLELPVADATLWEGARGSSGTAVLLWGTARGQQGLWLVRLDDEGNPSPIPASLEIPGGDAPLEVDLVATDDGFAAFWRRENAEGTAVVGYRRLACD